MKATLWNMTDEELTDFVANEIEQYKRDKATGSNYGAVKLSEIQAYGKNMQRARYSEKGQSVYEELKAILREDARIGVDENKERTGIKSLFEVYQKMNGYGRYNRTP